MESDEEIEESIVFETEDLISCHHASLISDKYRENMDAPTVANRLADMIIDLEIQPAIFKQCNDEFHNPDVDEIYYSDEDIFQSDDENEEDEDSEDEDSIDYEQLSTEEKVLWEEFKLLRKSFKKLSWNSGNTWNQFCKCQLLKKLSSVMNIKFKVDKSRANLIDHQLKTFQMHLSSSIQQTISYGRELLNSKSNCDHEMNEVYNLFEIIQKGQEGHLEETLEFVQKLTKKIDKQIRKVSVAPGEEGKWMNWLSDLYLEEKLFPALFPFGLGGFLSSQMLRQTNLGFSNYVKSRILSADSKFRNDASYVFFLLLVKEMCEMRRSEQTYFRKATKIPNLTARGVQDISKEYLIRFNSAYTTFKSCRGTSMYYQDVKKR